MLDECLMYMYFSEMTYKPALKMSEFQLLINKPLWYFTVKKRTKRKRKGR